MLQNPLIDINSQEPNGDTPLHCYVRKGCDGYPLLLALLSLSDPNSLDLEVPSEMLNTPLHLAAQVSVCVYVHACVMGSVENRGVSIVPILPVNTGINRPPTFAMNFEIRFMIYKHLSV